MKSAEDRLRAAFSENPILTLLIVSTCGLNVPLTTISNLARTYEAIDAGGHSHAWLKKHIREFLLKYFVSPDDGSGILRRTQVEDVTTWPVDEKPYGHIRRIQHGLPGQPQTYGDSMAAKAIVEKFFRGDGRTSSIKTRQMRRGNVSVYHFDDLNAENPNAVLDALEVVGIDGTPDGIEERVRSIWSERKVGLAPESKTLTGSRSVAVGRHRTVTGCLAQAAVFATYIRRNGLNVSFFPLSKVPNNVLYGNHDLKWEARFVQEDFYFPGGYEAPKSSSPSYPPRDKLLRVIAASWTDLIELTKTEFPSKEWLESLLNERIANLCEFYFRQPDTTDVDAFEIW